MTAFRATLAEGFGPPRHIHTREDETFLVLEGDVLFDVDGRIRPAGAGTSVRLTVRLRLSHAGARYLRHHRRAKLVVRVWFTPRSGRSRQRSATVRVER